MPGFITNCPGGHNGLRPQIEAIDNYTQVLATETYVSLEIKPLFFHLSWSVAE